MGSVATVAAAALGQWVNAPTAARLARLGAEIQAAGGPPSPGATAQIQKLQDRLLRATRLAAVLLGGSSVTMAAARFR